MRDLFKTIEHTTVSIGPGDPSFRLHDGLISVDRAGFKISKDCPREYAEVICQAINREWVKPVATVPKNDPTLIWDTLKSS